MKIEWLTFHNEKNKQDCIAIAYNGKWHYIQWISSSEAKFIEINPDIPTVTDQYSTLSK